MTTLLQRWFPRAASARSLSALLAETWLVEPEALQATLDTFREGASAFASAADIRAGIEMAEEYREARRRRPYSTHGGTAVIPIQGLIMREVPCMFRVFGEAATSTLETRQALAEALVDDEVKAIYLDVDSPGGTLAGTAELAEAIYDARQTKPIHAHAEDLVASAAYWIAAQASRFTAGNTATVGSIGVYRVLTDTSRLTEANHIRVHRLASGPHKGIGVPGVEITAEQLELEQARVNTAADLFKSAILRGRPALGAEALDALATGRTWFGFEAAEIGLVDAVDRPSLAFQACRLAATTEPQGSQTARTSTIAHGGNMPFRKRNSTSEEPREPASDTRIEALETENAELRDALEAAETRAREAEGKWRIAESMLASYKKDRLKGVLDGHQKAGRFDPSMRPQMEQIAATSYADNPEGLDDFLAQFESKDRRKPEGGLEGQTQTQVDLEGWDTLSLDGKANYGGRVVDLAARLGVTQ